MVGTGIEPGIHANLVRSYTTELYRPISIYNSLSIYFVLQIQKKEKCYVFITILQSYNDMFQLKH